MRRAMHEIEIDNFKPRLVQGLLDCDKDKRIAFAEW